jgi:acetyltransferase-like isoleucine patch superfamily enzyme/dTDP-4-dehydrorhamnose 3,5-epimerase-like enzyme
MMGGIAAGEGEAGQRDGAMVDASVTFGADCRVGRYSVIEPEVVIGDRVVIGAASQLLEGTRVHNDVRIHSNAVIGDSGDGAPVGRTTLQDAVAVGAGAVVQRGVTVGRHARVCALSVVRDDVPAHAVVRGNPALIVGYATEAQTAAPVSTATSWGPRESAVDGVRVIALTRADDLRGSMVASEFGELPFLPKRLFTVFGVPNARIRGSHAHRVCAQLLVCVAGSLSCIVDDAKHREEIVLDSPDFGLYVPPMVWGTQYNHSPDTVLVVLASHNYEPSDYIRDYDEFLAVVEGRQHTNQ